MKKYGELTGNSSYISRMNRVNTINLIRNNDGISRAEIVKISGLSAPTVTRIVEKLITDGLVSEIGTGESSGGRKPRRLHFSGGNNHVIGIDLGTTNIHGVLSDLEANIVAEKQRPTPVEKDFSSVMEQTAGVISDLKKQLKDKNKRILGIGMAVAGLINRQRNVVGFSPNFHWHDVDVVQELKKWHDIPVIFDNVTRVMAMGEMSYGVGRTRRNFICVNVGYGIGAGIIIDGKPLYGPTGMAGEFGHVTLDKTSRIKCDCGNYGCLEALASGSGIAKIARKALEDGVSSSLIDMCNGDVATVTARQVANAAKAGDSLAWSILKQSLEYLGIGIAGLINLFTPEAVVIGGGVAEAGDILFDNVREVVRKRALPQAAGETNIYPATFGLKAAMMGSVSLILQEILSLDPALKTNNT